MSLWSPRPIGQPSAITKSRAEVRRLVEQGSVQIDGAKITDPKTKLALRPGQILRLDKTRAVKIG